MPALLKSKHDMKTNRGECNIRRQQRRALKEKNLSERSVWHEKFVEVAKTANHRSPTDIAQRILRRIDSVKNQMVSRAIKNNCAHPISVAELRGLVVKQYGMPCRYCRRRLVLSNSTFDHIVPVSKGGASSIENTQFICRPCNHMKGSLDEASFNLLLTWLTTVPEDLRRDISIRLSGGIH